MNPSEIELLIASWALRIVGALFIVLLSLWLSVYLVERVLHLLGVWGEFFSWIWRRKRFEAWLSKDNERRKGILDDPK